MLLNYFEAQMLFGDRTRTNTVQGTICAAVSDLTLLVMEASEVSNGSLCVFVSNDEANGSLPVRCIMRQKGDSHKSHSRDPKKHINTKLKTFLSRLV